MSRLATVASIDAAPASARPQLEAVEKQIGSVPNLFRLVANSPAALEGYLGMSGALAKGSLPAQTRERIALAGASATLADIANYSCVAHAPEGNVSLEAYPRVRAWLARVEALPGFVPMVASRIGLRA